MSVEMQVIFHYKCCLIPPDPPPPPQCEREVGCYILHNDIHTVIDSPVQVGL